MDSLFQDYNYVKSNRRKLVSEINITPMVDIILVLLVIFMITSQVLVSGMEVDLPKTKSSSSYNDVRPLVISIDKNNQLYIFKSKINRKDLIDRLKNLTKEEKSTRIFLKGDQSVTYAIIVETMSLIYNAGFKKIILSSEDIDGY